MTLEATIIDRTGNLKAWKGYIKELNQYIPWLDALTAKASQRFRITDKDLARLDEIENIIRPIIRAM